MLFLKVRQKWKDTLWNFVAFQSEEFGGSKMMWLIFLFSFFSFISPTTTTLLYVPLPLLQSKSIKNQTCSNMFRFVKNSEKNLWKIDLNLVKTTDPGKVISKGMIDISGHPNIAAAGGGKTRIYKSAGKELSNRFSKASFKVPTLAVIHGRVSDLSFI